MKKVQDLWESIPKEEKKSKFRKNPYYTYYIDKASFNADVFKLVPLLKDLKPEELLPDEVTDPYCQLLLQAIVNNEDATLSIAQNYRFLEPADIPPFVTLEDWGNIEKRNDLLASLLVSDLELSPEHLGVNWQEMNWAGGFFAKPYNLALAKILEPFFELNNSLGAWYNQVKNQLSNKHQNWFEKTAYPVFKFIEDCYGEPKGLANFDNWKKHYGEDSLKYFPICSYGTKATFKSLVEALVDRYYNESVRDFNATASDVISLKRLIKAENSKCEKALFESGVFIYNDYLSILKNKIPQAIQNEGRTGFDHIERFCQRRAKALYLDYLDGRENVLQGDKRSTNLSNAEMATLGEVLRGLGLFRSRREAMQFLAMHFRFKHPQSGDVKDLSYPSMKDKVDFNKATKIINTFQKK